MATRLDGNVRKATANTVTSMRRSAANRQCPKCGRKSALVRMPGQDIISACRWADRGLCDYVRLRTVRYDDWFAALGNDIPAGNRVAAVEFLTGLNYDKGEARSTIGRAAHYIAEDKPEEALATIRSLMGSDETGVIRVAAVLCCPPAASE